MSNLNHEQLDAVTSGDGPVMVIAGAGSGKTRVITERICYLIKEKNILPRRILAVTFTNKAANEMKDRIRDRIDYNINDMWISTFHSFCARFLRIEYEYLLGYDRYFNILDTEDSQKVCKDVLKTYSDTHGYDLNIKPLFLQKMISSYKNIKDFILPSSLEFCFLELYELYKNMLKSLNSLDFDDLIIKTVELLEEHKDLRNKYRNSFDHILIDEFQDTNHIQYRLMTLLVNDLKNIFIVGDQDQSIYAFRGALVSNINQFKIDFPYAKQVILKINYRSTSSILNIANNLINNNEDRIKKDLVSNLSLDAKPVFKEFLDSFGEIRFITNEIKKLHQSGIKDIAILIRSNHLSRLLEDMFIKEGISYKILAGQSFYNRQEVKDIIAYLRLLIFDNENFSFKRVINVPKRRFGDTNLLEIENIASSYNISYFNSIPYLKGNNQGVINAKNLYQKLLELKDKLDVLSFEDICNQLLEITSYSDMLIQNDEEYRLANIVSFFDSIRERASNYTSIDGVLSNVDILRQTLLDIALITNLDEDTSNDCVKILTYHTAKGLEFNTVFMPFMLDGIFPSYYATLEDNISEERRVCYVGITRAMRNLYITKSSYKFAGNEYTTPSIFLKEMNVSSYKEPKSFLKQFIKPNSSKANLESLELDLIVGDKINHKAFGDGVVVSIEDNRLNIAFSAPIGVKIIQNNKKFLKKI